MAISTQAEIQIGPEVRHNWGWILALGIVLVLGGILLIGAPLAASFAVTYLIGAVLLVGGVVQVVHVLGTHGWSGILWSLITGVISIIGGIAIFANPFAGAVALTLVVAASFVAQGVAQIVLGLRIRPHRGWGWVLASGILSVVAGWVIGMNLFTSAAWVLGLIAGISVMFNGWAYIAIALTARTLNKLS